MKAAWVEFLSRYEWAWLFTATFQSEIHPEAANKKFRVWASLLAESYLGRGWRRKHKRAPVWVRGLEWQRRAVLHYHALVTNIPRSYVEFETRKLYCDVWAALDNAGFAWCDPCTGRDGAAAYLTKYVVKGGEIDFSSNARMAIPRLALAS
jgi:hypothetical protein